MSLTLVNPLTNPVIEKVENILTKYQNPYRTSCKVEKGGQAIVIRILKDLNVHSSRMLYRRRISLINNANTPFELAAVKSDLRTLSQGVVING